MSDLSDRSLRVAVSGIVHDDDPTIIADMQDRIDTLEAALTTIRDTLPERQDAYARLVFALAAGALEPEANS